jgi:hypothetical protein
VAEDADVVPQREREVRDLAMRLAVTVRGADPSEGQVGREPIRQEPATVARDPTRSSMAVRVVVGGRAQHRLAARNARMIVRRTDIPKRLESDRE